MALVNLPLFSLLVLSPESPRWLLATGRLDRAQELFMDVAKWNGAARKDSNFSQEFTQLWSEAIVDLPKLHELTVGDHLRNTASQIKLILDSPVARTRFILYLYPWFISGLAYYGIFLSVKFVHVNKHILVIIACFAEGAVLIMASLICNKVN